MSSSRRGKSLHGAGLSAITPDPLREVSCANCARLDELLRQKEAQIVQQARVLHWIKSLLKTSGQLGLTPSYLDRPARKGTGL